MTTRLAPRGLVDGSNPYSTRPRYEVAIRSQDAHTGRTSSLQEPTMLLTGHEGEIFAVRASPDGTCLASAGFDQQILLWSIQDDCQNFSTFKGHKGAVMEVHFSTDSLYLFSCSTDKTVRIWDMEVGRCIRKYANHTDVVNSVHPSRRGTLMCVSGSDDGNVLIHDIRAKEPAIKFANTRGYQVTAVTFNDAADRIISGGIDCVLKIWDTRYGFAEVMAGHQEMITGLALSPDGRHVLSNSMDCYARIWDIQPFFANQSKDPRKRCVRVFQGHQHNFERNLLKCAWSPDSKRIACGSSDRFTYVWQVSTGKIEYCLPGHQGSVNAVDFHPSEPILLSAGSDKRIYLGEIQPSTDITNGL